MKKYEFNAITGVIAGILIGCISALLLNHYDIFNLNPKLLIDVAVSMFGGALVMFSIVVSARKKHERNIKDTQEG